MAQSASVFKYIFGSNISGGVSANKLIKLR